MKRFFLSCKELRIEPTVPKSYYGCFYVGNFGNGQALTVANAIRRTLLSEISGVAITGVNIEGVRHEYATLSGMRETVLDVLLNLKEIVLKKTTSEPFAGPQIGYLQARGPGPVRASDFKIPSTVRLVDHDQYVATLTENGRLNLRFTIEEGKEFKRLNEISAFSSVHDAPFSTDDRWLPIEATFSPIKKVNYAVEINGSRSLEGSNQLVVLEIWTDGSLCPKQALSNALTYLRVLFTELGKLFVFDSILTTYSLQKNEKVQKTLRTLETDSRLTVVRDAHDTSSTVFSESNHPHSRKSDLTIEDLGLPFRLFRILSKANLKIVSKICEKTPVDLRALGGIGESELVFLKRALRKKGFTLRELGSERSRPDP